MVVLYGSRATGSPPPLPESDLDVAISFAVVSPPGFWECYRDLAEVFADHSLDLVPLANQDTLFRWEVMRDGVLLWGDPIEHLEHRAFAYRDFVDSADLRRLEKALFEKEMAFIRRRLNAAP